MTDSERTSRLSADEKPQGIRMPWQRRNRLVGQIARLSFTATYRHDDGPHDHLWHVVDDVRGELEPR